LLPKTPKPHTNIKILIINYDCHFASTQIK